MNVLCPVRKGFSTYCDHLTLPSAVQIHYLDPTPLAVWFGKHLCLCVYVYIHHPALKNILHMYVYIHICLYYCSLGREKTSQPGDDPSFVPLHSHKVSVMSFLCHLHHAMQHLNSFSVLVSSQCKECMASELLNVRCARLC